MQLPRTSQFLDINDLDYVSGREKSFFFVREDTCRMNFTKNLGCRFNSLEYRHLCERIKVFEVFFDGKYSSERLPQHHNFHVQVLEDGVITCAICSNQFFHVVKGLSFLRLLGDLGR